MTRYQYYRSQRDDAISANSAPHGVAESRQTPPCNPDRVPTPSWGVPGMAYVPDLGFVNLYAPKAALPAGTLFRDLEYPFLGAGGKR